jgi:hypothetical protein
MTTQMARWQDIEDDTKDKYNRYLASREWGKLREAVRRRCDGICERCDRNPMDACHHLTYERKYDERLEDLQAICNECHEWTHGKSDVDPAESVPDAWGDYVTLCLKLNLEPVTHDITKRQNHWVDAIPYRVVLDGVFGLMEQTYDASRTGKLYPTRQNVKTSNIPLPVRPDEMEESSSLFCGMGMVVQASPMCGVGYFSWLLADCPRSPDWSDE